MVVMLTATPAKAGCTYKQEYFDTWPLTPYGCSSGAFNLLAQSFVPQRNFTLCKVDIIGHGVTGGGPPTLYIQDDPCDPPGTIYTQKTITVTSQVDQWHTFDVPDIHLIAGQEYFIRVAGNISWCRYQDQGGGDPYPNGKAYGNGDPIEDGTPQNDKIDHWFITYSEGLEGDTVLKWEQLPNTESTGIDIRVDNEDGVVPPRIVADDFECNEPERITDVHFWGSWLDDEKGDLDSITVSFWSNIPPGVLEDYSMPGNLLWQQTFGAGEFTEKLVAEVEPNEWWWGRIYRPVPRAQRNTGRRQSCLAIQYLYRPTRGVHPTR